jgi:hypothetical protein
MSLLDRRQALERFLDGLLHGAGAVAGTLVLAGSLPAEPSDPRKTTEDSGKDLEYQWSRLVARAWAEPEFKKRLLADPATVLKENGVVVPPGVQVRVLESTDKVLYMTVPVAVAMKWADPAFRQRLLADPAAVLKENGVPVPPGVQVQVVENTDKLVHLILPRPPSPKDLSEEDLRPPSGSRKVPSGRPGMDRCFERCSASSPCDRCYRCSASSPCERCSASSPCERCSTRPPPPPPSPPPSSPR